MSNPSREPARPQIERSGNMNDVLRPLAYEIAVTPTPVEERPSISPGIESERPPPGTPPMAQSNAPIQERPVRLEYRHPLDHIQNDPSRNTSYETLPGGNATHTRADQSAPAPQGREEEGGESATVARAETIPPVQPKPNGNEINIFCYCSSRGASPGQYKRFSILWLPTNFLQGQS